MDSDQSDAKRGFVADVVLNAVEPGVNQSVLICFNLVCVVLLATLVTIMVFLVGLNVHVIIMSTLACGVLVGVNW